MSYLPGRCRICAEVHDEPNCWPHIPCSNQETHEAHKFMGSCGLPEWCIGR